MRLWALCLLALFLGSGCVSNQSTTVGMAGGAAAGVGIGAALGNPILGAIVGLGLGTAGGALVQGHQDKERAKKEKKELEQQLEAANPPTPMPQKSFIEGHYEHVKKKRWLDTSQRERVWVDEHEEEGKTIDGHYEERLTPSGYWEESEEKVWVPDHYE
ncbi:MAG TPA: hypothetical protein VJZ02_03265 [Candidatus Brocadiales bacterium]|nr:hypothetical protein [Candidatus Brocadiales bacterium]